MKQLYFFILFFVYICGFSQEVSNADFIQGDCNIKIIPQEKKVIGTIEYSFNILKPTDSVSIDAHNMKFKDVTLNESAVEFVNNGQKLIVYHKFLPEFKYRISFSYSAYPKKAMYFIGWDYPKAKKQVWTQGQGKYTSNWMPSFNAMDEKLEFDLSIDFPKEYEVIANGKLIDTVEKGSNLIWHYDMIKPMSSYLLGIAAGNYLSKSYKSDSGIPIELFYYPEDSLYFEPTYRYSKDIFDFLENEIDVSYPWQNYKQIPVKDFLYAGMENTTATIFSDSFVVDSIGFTDKNYVNVNAHELAHQWFGNLVTEKNSEHHWIHEGFASYYALLTEKKIFGEDYYYERLYESTLRLLELSDSGKGESLTNPKASSLTFYQKGALALHILREKVGENTFKKAVRSFLQTNAYNTVEVNDFIQTLERKAGVELVNFKENWLRSPILSTKEIFESLGKNKKINQLLQFKKDGMLGNSPPKITGIDLDSRLLVEEIMKNSWDSTSVDKILLAKKIISTNDLKTRQIVAIHTDSIPPILLKEFEGLLEDESYTTIEHALFQLWLQFPEKRVEYLGKVKNINGFKDKGLRILWLTLALATQSYEEFEKPEYFNELLGYTAPYNHFEIRQNAFNYIYQLNAFSDRNLRDLINACGHPVWQFSKFSRELLEQLLKQEEYNHRFKEIFSELSGEEQDFLSKYLKLKE